MRNPTAFATCPRTCGCTAPTETLSDARLNARVASWVQILVGRLPGACSIEYSFQADGRMSACVSHGCSPVMQDRLMSDRRKMSAGSAYGVTLTLPSMQPKQPLDLLISYSGCETGGCHGASALMVPISVRQTRPPPVSFQHVPLSTISAKLFPP